jgi:ubiquinone biosynthesis protein
MNIGRLSIARTDTLRSHRLRLPPDLVLMIKALVAAEGTARTLCPELNVVSEARERISELAAERYRPEIIWRNIRFGLSLSAEAGVGKPKTKVRLERIRILPP